MKLIVKGDSLGGFTQEVASREEARAMIKGILLWESSCWEENTKEEQESAVTLALTEFDTQGEITEIGNLIFAIYRSGRRVK